MSELKIEIKADIRRFEEALSEVHRDLSALGRCEPLDMPTPWPSAFVTAGIPHEIVRAVAKAAVMHHTWGKVKAVVEDHA